MVGVYGHSLLWVLTSTATVPAALLPLLLLLLPLLLLPSQSVHVLEYGLGLMV